MHLMVLGASRLESALGSLYRNAVSMHLMVLGASRRHRQMSRTRLLQVSMHLMVLGASRHAVKPAFQAAKSESQCT